MVLSFNDTAVLLKKTKKDIYRMRQLMVLLALIMVISVSACHKIHKTMPNGHDPEGPGNSENAPGHNN